MRNTLLGVALLAVACAGASEALGQTAAPKRGRKLVPPSVRIAPATVTGDIDKKILRRRVRRKLPAIRHCYASRLRVTPTIGDGTVVAKFTIDGAAVVASKAVWSGSASKDPVAAARNEVARCVAEVLGTMAFPVAVGGGLVHVRYPFALGAAAGAASAPGKSRVVRPATRTTVSARLAQLRAILAADGPDDDKDGDRILNKNDKCPGKPEVYNGIDDGDGCPDRRVETIENSSAPSYNRRTKYYRRSRFPR